MPGDRSFPRTVALRLDGLSDENVAQVHAALAAAGLGTGSGVEQPGVVVTGPVTAAVALEAESGRPVLAVSPEDDRSTTSGLLAAGAAGVVVAAEVATALVPAVHAVAAGLCVVPRGGRDAVQRPLLTTREKQVLGLVVMGLTNNEIGRRLFLAESTVKYHLLSTYAKLGVKTRKEATDLVLDPRNDLSAGVLGITGARPVRRRRGYSEPNID